MFKTTKDVSVCQPCLKTFNINDHSIVDTKFGQTCKGHIILCISDKKITQTQTCLYAEVCVLVAPGMLTVRQWNTKTKH